MNQIGGAVSISKKEWSFVEIKKEWSNEETHNARPDMRDNIKPYIDPLVDIFLKIDPGRAMTVAEQQINNVRPISTVSTPADFINLLTEKRVDQLESNKQIDDVMIFHKNQNNLIKIWCLEYSNPVTSSKFVWRELKNNEVLTSFENSVLSSVGDYVKREKLETSDTLTSIITTRPKNANGFEEVKFVDLVNLQSPNTPVPGLQNVVVEKRPLDNPVLEDVDAGASVYDQIPDTETNLGTFITSGIVTDSAIPELKKFSDLTTELDGIFTQEKKQLTVKVLNVDKNIFEKYTEVKNKITEYVTAAQQKINQINENFNKNSQEPTTQDGKPKLMFHTNELLDTSSIILDKNVMKQRIANYDKLVEEYNQTHEPKISPIPVEKRNEILKKIDTLPDSWDVSYYIIDVQTVSGTKTYKLDSRTFKIQKLNDYARAVLFTVKNVNIYFELLKKTLEAVEKINGLPKENPQVGEEDVISPASGEGPRAGGNATLDRYRYNGKLYKVREGPRGGLFIVVDGKKVRVSS